MNATSPLPYVASEALTDEVLVERSRHRDEDAVRVLTRRHSRRLYRIARGILRDDADAEDVVQETYVRAFTSLERFRGDAAFGTWLTRIAMNEALGRVRRRRPHADIDDHPALSATHEDPETMTAQREIRDRLEQSIDNLPDIFRSVFVARMVEGLSIEETADLLGLRPETVKTRVHRARLRLRADLGASLGARAADAFPFDGPRCTAMTEAVVQRLRAAWGQAGVRPGFDRS
jgi:RNA polymerase sigma-70 factor, ECF subfamily